MSKKKFYSPQFGVYQQIHDDKLKKLLEKNDVDTLASSYGSNRKVDLYPSPASTPTQIVSKLDWKGGASIFSNRNRYDSDEDIAALDNSDSFSPPSEDSMALRAGQALLGKSVTE
jgi:hypothetical protein